MAAIDKTYLNSWEKYQEFKNWLNDQGTVVDDFGNTFRPITMLWDMCEEDFKNGWRAIASFPTHTDIWLIRNCPLEYIQTGLEEQYSSYQDIKNRVSDYDSYQRNGLGKNIKVKIQDIPCRRNIRKGQYGKCYWTALSVKFPNDSYVSYHDYNDVWLECEDMRNNSTRGWVSSEFRVRGYMSRKAIYRKLQKWNLPEGAMVTIEYHYIDKIDGCRYLYEEIVIVKSK